jgi:hypothetical protein
MKISAIALVGALCLATAVLADDDDYPSWRPTNTAAVSITGPIILLPNRLHAGEVDFPLRLDGMVAKFKADQGPIPARVYAVTRPVNPRLLNGARLCGDTPATWIVVVPVPPDGLEIDAFTATDKPAGQDSPGLCGTFSYNR